MINCLKKKKSELPPEKKPPHFSQRVETCQAQDKSQSSLTEKQKWFLFFFVPDIISNVTKVLPLTQSPPQDPKAPSNAERPWFTSSWYKHQCIGSTPHRLLFPTFAKECNTALIAIGSNCAQSQKFSWAFFQQCLLFYTAPAWHTRSTCGPY